VEFAKPILDEVKCRAVIEISVSGKTVRVCGLHEGKRGYNLRVELQFFRVTEMRQHSRSENAEAGSSNIVSAKNLMNDPLEAQHREHPHNESCERQQGVNVGTRMKSSYQECRSWPI